MTVLLLTIITVLYLTNNKHTNKYDINAMTGAAAQPWTDTAHTQTQRVRYTNTVPFLLSLDRLYTYGNHSVIIFYTSFYRLSIIIISYALVLSVAVLLEKVLREIERKINLLETNLVVFVLSKRVTVLVEVTYNVQCDKKVYPAIFKNFSWCEVIGC